MSVQMHFYKSTKQLTPTVTLEISDDDWFFYLDMATPSLAQMMYSHRVDLPARRCKGFLFDINANYDVYRGYINSAGRTELIQVLDDIVYNLGMVSDDGLMVIE